MRWEVRHAYIILAISDIRQKDVTTYRLKLLSMKMKKKNILQIRNGKKYLAINSQGKNKMDINNFEIIKQSLGNVIYSQKTQEMATIRKRRYTNQIKWFNIILVGMVLLVLCINLFNPNEQIYNKIGSVLTVI